MDARGVAAPGPACTTAHHGDRGPLLWSYLGRSPRYPGRDLGIRVAQRRMGRDDATAPAGSTQRAQRASMFTWGTGDDNDAKLDGPNASLFDKVSGSKHKIVFEGGNHFDYLPTDLLMRCGSNSAGPCDLVSLLAADFAALFLARYMPPPMTTVQIAPSLQFIDPGELTPEQEFYAGAHLVGLSLIGGNSDCSLTHSWILEGGATGMLTLPN